jgi:hypothetical protein
MQFCDVLWWFRKAKGKRSIFINPLFLGHRHERTEDAMNMVMCWVMQLHKYCMCESNIKDKLLD